MSETATQHPSHQNLLSTGEPALDGPVDAEIDAIIVPSGRPSASVAEAARLANQLNRPLVVLCSRESRRDQVIAHVRATTPEITAIAVDFPPTPPAAIGAFETAAMLAGGPFHRHGDTSAKRNVGLMLARAAGWQRILFLDDDITIPDPRDLHRVASVLGGHAAVGLRIGGMPDNSVVCHAIRRTGGRQDTFLGGGAMAVNIGATTSFFPKIYNEDWFFLLDDSGLRPVTSAGVACQEPYDPFADPDRAAQEEFGDVLAEGVFAILDDGGKIGDASAGYWRGFLRHRSNLIGKLARRARRLRAGDERERILASLYAAHASAALIDAESCVEYLRAWQRDLSRWRDRFDAFEVAPDVETALRRVGVSDRYIRWDGATGA